MSACHAEDREFESRRPRQISIPKNFPTRKGGKFFAFIEKFGGGLGKILPRPVSFFRTFFPKRERVFCFFRGKTGGALKRILLKPINAENFYSNTAKAELESIRDKDRIKVTSCVPDIQYYAIKFLFLLKGVCFCKHKR